MISERVQQAIHEQIGREFYASQLYLAMSAYLEGSGYTGFARWMRLQAEEERLHALRLFDFLNDRGGRVVLLPVGQPPGDYGSPLEVFEAALEHERKVTSQIHALYRLAMEEDDYATQVMLQWFVNEQVEEEKTASEIVDRLKLAGDDNSAILVLEREVADRRGSTVEAGGEGDGGE